MIRCDNNCDVHNLINKNLKCRPKQKNCSSF
jgi:hypothetical protein